MTIDFLKQFNTEVDELLDIIDEFSVITNNNYNLESIKPTILEMINFIIKNKDEANALIDWMDHSDFWIAPASTKFHGNFKCGLSLHTLIVIRQVLIFAKNLMENFYNSPNRNLYEISVEDIFISALSHDFCKTNFYGVEYRNTKDINGNWIKQPFYKVKSESRNLGHGNESVLILLEIMPSLIKKRYVIEAISRHMGFSDLSSSEEYNYSNFLQNPLVILLQLADQTASQWHNA